MAILGLGTDIAEIERIDKALGRSGEPFARRILSEDEMAKFSQLKQQGRYLAKRFAAKEAASKALGTGIAQGVTFHDFTVSNDELGKPVLMLSGVAQKMGRSNVGETTNRDYLLKLKLYLYRLGAKNG